MEREGGDDRVNTTEVLRCAGGFVRGSHDVG